MTAGLIVIVAMLLAVWLIADYARVRLIHFQRVSRRGTRYWEFAFGEADLREKLNGEMAEVEMPAAPLAVRMWRRFFPLKLTEMKVS